MILYVDERLRNEKGEMPVMCLDTTECLGKMEIRTTAEGKIIWLFLLNDYAEGMFFDRILSEYLPI